VGLYQGQRGADGRVERGCAPQNDLRTALRGDELRALEQAIADGTIDVTQAHDLAGIAQGEDSKALWNLRPVMRWASFLFHHAEKFNRQTTFIASYRLARAAGANHASAVAQATNMTYAAHFDYSAGNRPRVMQGPVAKVLLLFKQFGQNMIYTIARQAYLAMKAASPEDRGQARKALGGILAMHATAAGVLGLPLVSTLLAAASLLGGSDDEPWDAETALRNLLADWFGNDAAEVLAKGVTRLTPWDASARVGLDKLILPDVQEGLEGQRLGEAAMAASLGPVAGIGINTLKAVQLIAEGQFGRGIEAMMPAALRGPVKALRYANEGAVDKTGIPLVDEVGAAGIAGQVAGFAPSEVQRATEGKSAVYRLDRALSQRRSLLLHQYSRSVIHGDDDGARDMKQEIQHFNEKNPDRRIKPAQMTASVRATRARINKSEDGIYLPKSHQGAREAGAFAAPDDGDDE
jgi:hypothetical protein